MKLETIAFKALGTVNTIEIPEFPDGSAGRLLENIRDEIFRLDDLFSVFKEDSEISKINRSAGLGCVAVSEDTFALLSDCIYFGRLTGGLFDVTSGPLIDLWGIGKKGEYIPSEEEIHQAQKPVNYKDIILKGPGTLSAGLKEKGESVNLGGIAKGFAADRAVRMLREHGTDDAYVNFGGSISVIGHPRDIFVRNPFDKNGAPVICLSLQNASCVTSGAYEQFFIKDGIRYHHILNPETGYPANEGILSATLTGASAEELDVYATTVIISGMKKAQKLMSRKNLHGVFVLEDGSVLKVFFR